MGLGYPQHHQLQTGYNVKRNSTNTCTIPHRDRDLHRSAAYSASPSSNQFHLRGVTSHSPCSGSDGIETSVYSRNSDIATVIAAESEAAGSGWDHVRHQILQAQIQVTTKQLL